MSVTLIKWKRVYFPDREKRIGTKRRHSHTHTFFSAALISSLALFPLYFFTRWCWRESVCVSVQAVCPSIATKNDCSNQASRRGAAAGADSCRIGLNLHTDIHARVPALHAHEVFAWKATAWGRCWVTRCYSANTCVGDGATPECDAGPFTQLTQG